MTNEGVKELYLFLSAAFPLVIKQGSNDEYKLATMKTLYQAYKDYGDDEVLEAYRTWCFNNEKYPAFKNIKNELTWAKKIASPERPRFEQKYYAEIITDKGIEYAYGYGDKNEFTWDEFINLPCNPRHLTPVEWDRRFMKRRAEIIDRLFQEAQEEQKREHNKENIQP